jgi:thiol-disulfide isomerase/thioredoxin
MISMKRTETRKQFWTAWRLACAASVCLALAVAPGCTSDDKAGERANANANANASASGQPSVSVTQQRGATAPQAPASNQQPGFVAISEQALNAEIQPLDGEPFRLADFKDKVVVLDIWATWCAPCRYEIPHLVEISKDYAAKGVEVIGLTLENPQTDEGKVREFAKQFKINYKLGWARADVAQELMAGRGNIPQTYIIKDGKIIKRFIGFSPEQSPAMMLSALNEATGTTSGD